ncbi:MAG: hypothetical protein RHS_1155 [Robinsoniella sp. RHS]|nr:MAG: hypothetical protein RHS_1155 [Robinsoniella sp. RHS]
MNGTVYRDIGICGFNKDHTISLAAVKLIILYRYIFHSSRLIPALCITGNIDCRHGRALKHIFLNQHRFACCNQYSSGWDLLKCISANLHFRRIGNILCHKLPFLYLIRNRLCKPYYGIRKTDSFTAAAGRAADDFLHCTNGILQGKHVALPCKLYLISFKETWKSCCFIVIISYCHFSSVTADTHYLLESSVYINRIIMWICKITVLYQNLSSTA